MSPRAQEEVDPEMRDKELPLLLLLFFREKRAAQGPSSEEPAQVLLFTYLHCLQTGNLIGYVERSAFLMSLSLLLYKQIYIRLGLK